MNPERELKQHQERFEELIDRIIDDGPPGWQPVLPIDSRAAEEINAAYSIVEYYRRALLAYADAAPSTEVAEDCRKKAERLRENYTFFVQAHLSHRLRRLNERGNVTPSASAERAGRLGVEFVDLRVVPVDPAALAVLPAALARRYQVFPVRLTDRPADTPGPELSQPILTIAVNGSDAGPLHWDDIAEATGCDIRVVFANDDALREQIDRYYGDR
ncbi:MAG: hypothetical protein ACLQVD_15835 [Capsulimonadaceae bacterium]